MHVDTPPNQTIYINNLNEKVKKEGFVSVTVFTAASFLSVAVERGDVVE